VHDAVTGGTTDAVVDANGVSATRSEGPVVTGVRVCWC